LLDRFRLRRRDRGLPLQQGRIMRDSSSASSIVATDLSSVVTLKGDATPALISISRMAERRSSRMVIPTSVNLHRTRGDHVESVSSGWIYVSLL